MPSNRRSTTLPNSLAELKALAKKLKKKEAGLLVDLAIREYPEFEDGVVELYSSHIIFLEALRTLMLAEKPEDEEGNEAVQRRIQIYQNQKRVAENTGRDTSKIDDAIAKLKGALTSTKVLENFQHYKNDRDAKAKTFIDYWHKWEPKFLDASVNLKEFLPDCASAYKEACRCLSITPVDSKED